MRSTPPSVYLGRFAPSPSGPLHFGSLVAATASWFDARAAGGRWLLRIDDVDTPRVVPGAAEDILATLERFGFYWDEEPVWQSRRSEAYAAALESLRQAGMLFPCACSRRELADSALARDGSYVYPGTCRHGTPPGRAAKALRIRARGCIRFDDALQGPQQEDLEQEVGDFVLRRADGIFAYQLAVVVDDAAAGVTDIVRGADLLASTSRQIYLQQQLGLLTPRYAHVPVALSPTGQKLSKQNLARAIAPFSPAATLHAALEFLGQAPPAGLATASLQEIHDWGIAHWRLAAVAHTPALNTPPAFTAQ